MLCAMCEKEEALEGHNVGPRCLTINIDTAFKKIEQEEVVRFHLVRSIIKNSKPSYRS